MRSALCCFAPCWRKRSSRFAIARQWIEEAETNGFKEAGYKFLLGTTLQADELAMLQTAFEVKLDELEQALGQYPGSYFLITFSLVDIMYSPHLDRLAGSLPVYRGYSIKGNPRFPRINAWFAALTERPAYHRVKSDDITNSLLFRRLWGVEPSANLLPPDPAISHTLDYRAEAAERFCDNTVACHPMSLNSLKVFLNSLKFFLNSSIFSSKELAKLAN